MLELDNFIPETIIFNHFKNYGFSLVEIMIATAALSVLSLGIMSQLKVMAKGQATSEIKMEELELRRQITTLLTDKGACQNTFLNTAIGDTISQVKSASNSVMYKVGTIYGNNSLKIINFLTVDKNLLLSDGTKSIDLVITFQKMKNIVTQNIKQAVIPVSVTVDSVTGKITTCYSDTQAVVSNAKTQFCIDLGGAWDGTSCSLPACPPGEVLQSISAAGAICKTLSCPSGKIFNGIDGTGEIICNDNIPVYQ